MENNTFSQKTNASADNAKNAARDLSTATTNLGNTAKQAGKQVRRVTEQEFSNIKGDLDALVSSLPGLSDIDLEAAKQKLLDNFEIAKTGVKEYAGMAKEKINYGVEAGGEYVKERPFQSIAAAAAFGLLIGALIARR